MALVVIDNEKELIQQAAFGNEKAFAELFYGYHNQLAEFVLSLTDSFEMTEEIIQDVFVKIWINRSDLPKIEKFTSYLFILCRNYTLNCIRQADSIRKNLAQYGRHLDNEGLITQEVAQNDTTYLPLIERAIALLPPQQQKVYLLSRQEGLKHAEIAEQMNLSKETVKKYIQWATESITKFVKSHPAIITIILMAKR
jgi:RNA polymerase sigma-70 factor (family 1)